MHSETFFVSDHPVCAAAVASRHFLIGAATPPHEEGISPASRPPRSFLEEHERNAIPVSTDGSHRHDPNVGGTESKLLDEVVPHFRRALTREQELFIQRSGRCIAFNDDSSILRKPQEV